jgi:hypothetical protein
MFFKRSITLRKVMDSAPQADTTSVSCHTFSKVNKIIIIIIICFSPQKFNDLHKLKSC